MRQFKDKNGDKWEIALTSGLVMKLRRTDERFDLLDSAKTVDGQPLSIALNDFGLFYELLWHLVEAQATSKGMNAEQFGDLMAADCLYFARVEFFAEWHDFFQGLQRVDHVAALEKLQKYNAKALELVQATIAQAGPEVDAYLDNRMEIETKKQLGNLRESLALIQAPTP